MLVYQTRSEIVAWDPAIVGRLQQHPRPLADRFADELDVAVAEAGVGPPGVATAGLRGHPPIVRTTTAAHAVGGADADLPEVRAGFNLVGLVEPVVGRRVAVPARDDDAGAG